MIDALWYLARASGVVSLVLLTVVMALGVTTRSGRPALGLPRFAVSAIHRNASLLAVSFIAVHVLTLLFDPYAQLKLVDIVLPFAGAYRPLWLGLGTVAFDLVVALVVTTLLRHRIGRRGWRATHWLAYAAWPVAFLHGWFTGTDSGELWLRALAIGCAAVVVTAICWRVSTSFTGATSSETFDTRANERSPQLERLP